MQFEHLVLGSFLHDIGKLLQRAEVPLSEQSKRMMAVGGPSREGRPTHFHVQWTNQFFEEVLPRGFLPGPSGVEESASALAFRHHNASTPLQSMISLADCLASGVERGEQVDYSRDIHKRTPLISLLTEIVLQDGRSPSLLGFRLEPLQPELGCLSPVPRGELNSSLVPGYKTLWSAFEKELTAASPESFPAALAYLDALMERYTWCVPASTIDDVADSSLYDHSRAVAALAASLYRFHEAEGTLDDTACIRDREAQRFLLVVGDLSGIQRYIFDIANVSSRGTAKALRARSFLLGMASDFAAWRILEIFQLPHFNRMVAAGGKFYLLLPNLPDAAQRLADLTRSIERWFHQDLNAELTLNLATLPLRGNDFLKGRFAGAMIRLQDELAGRKLRPLRAALTESGSWRPEAFVLPRHFEGEDRVCTVCRKFPGEERTTENGDRLCDGCAQDRRLGRELPRARYLSWLKDDAEDAFHFVGVPFRLHRALESVPTDAVRVLAFNDAPIPASSAVPFHRRWIANHVPAAGVPGVPDCPPSSPCRQEGEGHEAGAPLYFNCLALHGEGRDVLGVLKLDVDNLGLVLSIGLKDTSQALKAKTSPAEEPPPGAGWTLSRLATFSRHLDLFFAGWLHRELTERHPLLYTIFSGGDDLFLLGPWHEVLNFARGFHAAFRQFCGGNPDLTLSGGFTLAHARTPVFMIADQTENALKVAKRAGKDRLAAFDDVLRWKELDRCHAEAERLAEWQQAETVSTQLVRRLLLSAKRYYQYRDDGVTDHLIFLPHLHYSVKRNLSQSDGAAFEWAMRLVNEWPLGRSSERKAPWDGLKYISTYSLNRNRGGANDG